jgi:HSF-type DNA-binding
MADTKLTSFQRQLNLYGFRRITKGDDHGAYFQRGRKDLVANIRRLPVKATNSASAETPSTDSEATSR